MWCKAGVNKMFINSSPIYNAKDIKHVLDKYCYKVYFQSNRSKNEERKAFYFNCPAAFDIETTSFMEDNTKKAFMYQWQFGINGAVIFGRTWNEFVEMCKEISEYLHLNHQYRLLIYVHNLGYEFQFFRHLFEWENIFSIDERKPVKAISLLGIEFRCSYTLSGYSLAKVGSSLAKYQLEKMVGDLDYSLVRNSLTPLTEKEMKYCENDVRVVMSYIQNKIEEDGDITRIALTKTSYVRRFVRNNTIYSNNNRVRNSYSKKVRHLTLEVDEYEMAKRAFSGGYTHASAQYVDKVLENVDSFDFTSSYPYVMLAYKFPMTKGRKIIPKDKDEALKYINGKCLSIFNIRFSGLREKENAPDNIISLSKCYNKDGSHYSQHAAIVNNGRIVLAYQDVYTTITNIDFECINKFYDYDDFEIFTMYTYLADYLPTPFCECIVKLYKDKTELKGVDGMEEDYKRAKEMLNSLYGMCVTDICRDDILYDNEWEVEPLTSVEMADRIKDYNESKSRFLSYIWGVFVTAYARRNVYSGIMAFGNDYVYCDTDSNKVLNAKNHMDYIERYNKNCIKLLEIAFDYHGFNKKDIAPLDINGKSHPLGVWDWETKNNPYLQFKTLGAKRYLVRTKDKYEMTVAGLPKKTVNKLVEIYGDKLFDVFCNDFEVLPDETTKNCVSYIDAPCEGTITDYLGNTTTYKELSYIHMGSIGFYFNRDKSYVDYLMGLRLNESA